MSPNDWLLIGVRVVLELVELVDANSSWMIESVSWLLTKSHERASSGGCGDATRCRGRGMAAIVVAATATAVRGGASVSGELDGCASSAALLDVEEEEEPFSVTSGLVLVVVDGSVTSECCGTNG